ncbi:hypothetical protein DFH09DRAFT_1374276 [Mycena vulgaris]|nr:hypothetical protein DFH09DRAFT_1374276 [Mycena vulgaris]
MHKVIVAHRTAYNADTRTLSRGRHRTPRTFTPPASTMNTADAGTRAHGVSTTALSFAHEQGHEHEHEHKQPRLPQKSPHLPPPPQPCQPATAPPMTHPQLIRPREPRLLRPPLLAQAAPSAHVARKARDGGAAHVERGCTENRTHARVTRRLASGSPSTASRAGGRRSYAAREGGLLLVLV